VLQDRLLGVQPVLCLVPGRGPRAIEDLVGDLLAPVGGEVVEDPDPRVREGHEGRVDLVPRKAVFRASFSASSPIETQTSV